MVALASSSSLLSSPCVFLGQKLAFANANANANGNAAVPLPQVVSVRFRTPSISASYTTSERTRPLYSSPTMASSASLYEVLGLSTAATLPEIKSAYRKLARVCHPDVVAIDRKDSSANEFKKIYAAYSTLSDPEKRAEYDRNLFVGQRIYRSPHYSASSYASASSAMSGFSGPSRRTWETDQCW